MNLGALLDPLIPHIDTAKDLVDKYAYRVVCLLEDIRMELMVNDEDHPSQANYVFWRQQFSTNLTDFPVAEVPVNELWALEVVTFGKGGTSSSFWLHGRPNFTDVFWEWETSSSVRTGGSDTPQVLIPGGTKLLLSTLSVVPGGFGNAEVYLQFRKYRPGDETRKRQFVTGRSHEAFTGTGTHDMRDALVRGTPQAAMNGD